MFDETDEYEDDLEDDDDQEDDGDDGLDAAAAAAAAKEEADLAADAKAKADAKAAKKAAAKPADEGPDQAEIVQFALNTLKASFTDAAKAEGYVTADFDGIGLKGVDDGAKAAFIAEAKASHEGKVAALAAQGFIYSPEAAAGAGKDQELDAQDAQAQRQWGATGPGQAASGDEKFSKQVEDEVKAGDTMGVIGSLVGQGGLGSFFVRGRKS